jgi:hypothetical protein
MPRRTLTVVALAALLITSTSAAAEYGISPIPPAPGVAPPRLGGYLQVRETYQSPTNLTATLNRARLSADGSLPSHFSYRFLVEYESVVGPRAPSVVALRDAYIRWNVFPVTTTFGQFKVPFSREYLTSITVLETAERSSVVDTLAPKRDIGVSVDCALSTWGLVSLGMFNGEGQNASLNRDSTAMWVGRVMAHPISQLTVAGHLAYYSADSTRYGADASIEAQGLLVRAELLGQRKAGRDRDDLGWFVLGGVRVFPWLQLIAKQEDFQRPGISMARRMSATTGGINLDLPGGRTRAIIDLISRKTGYPRVQRNALITQLQVRF